jgi:polyhydroxyalkanoate synthesis regulator phasin
MTTEEPENLTNVILRQIQADIATLKADSAIVKENTGRIDRRLKTVEAHMTGFLSSCRYLENEMDALRGRVEALEEALQLKDTH